MCENTWREPSQMAPPSCSSTFRPPCFCLCCILGGMLCLTLWITHALPSGSSPVSIGKSWLLGCWHSYGTLYLQESKGWTCKRHTLFPQTCPWVLSIAPNSAVNNGGAEGKQQPVVLPPPVALLGFFLLPDLCLLFFSQTIFWLHSLSQGPPPQISLLSGEMI